jgi:hypothetical protein
MMATDKQAAKRESKLRRNFQQLPMEILKKKLEWHLFTKKEEGRITPKRV